MRAVWYVDVSACTYGYCIKLCDAVVIPPEEVVNMCEVLIYGGVYWMCFTKFCFIFFMFVLLYGRCVTGVIDGAMQCLITIKDISMTMGGMLCL